MLTEYSPGTVGQFTAPSGGVVSGVAIKIGDSIVVPLADAAEGEQVACERVGTFRIGKLTGASTGGAQGVRAYWNAAGAKVTAVSTSNQLIGTFAKTCVDGDAYAVVFLDGANRVSN